jgi:hypothetical protein
MKYRIKQAFVSPSVASFKQRWFNMFDLVNYTDIKEPVVFFYNRIKDVNIIIKHRSKCIVVITTSFISNKNLEILEKNLANRHYITIIAHPIMAKKLKEFNINSYWPKNGIFAEKVAPVKLGNMIYTYIPKKEFILKRGHYNLEVFNELQNKKYPILLGDGSIPMNRWYNGESENYYSKCFVGLNLAIYCGGQTSIVDLGLRGIRCITNNLKLPSTIPWNSIQDIKNAIKNESKNIGTVNYELAKQVYESMDYKQKWLEINI